MLTKIVSVPVVVIDLREFQGDPDNYQEFGAAILDTFLRGNAPILAGYSPEAEPWLLHVVLIAREDAEKLAGICEDIGKMTKGWYQNGGWLS